MKKLVIFLCGLMATIVVNSQQLSYTYDAAGNRISRTIVLGLKNADVQQQEFTETIAKKEIKIYGFVKQKDGNYNYSGATDADLVLMRNNCNKSVQIKAAGGIRTLDDLLRVKALGVTRVGTTSTKNILQEAKDRGYI